ncbi:MAG: hypothetical protein SNJ70_09050 [Armatimonadota bacterium]
MPEARKKTSPVVSIIELILITLVMGFIITIAIPCNSKKNQKEIVSVIISENSENNDIGTKTSQ